MSTADCRAQWQRPLENLEGNGRESVAGVLGLRDASSTGHECGQTYEWAGIPQGHPPIVAEPD